MPPIKRKQKNTIPKGFDRIRTYQGTEEYLLKKNGLRVLYKQNKTSPVVGVMVTYLVGSRHEVNGTTGATHILEHLMFKGSKKFPPKNGESALDRLDTIGAQVNASTFLDRTNYYEVFPDKHVEYVLQLEADRMRNAILTEKDLQEELPAVLSEYSWKMDNPKRFLETEVWATAFLAHPYRHSTLGWLSDIKNTSVQKLREFYDTHYYPNNAVVTVIGTIERERALSLIEKYFGVHKSSPKPIPQPSTTEPEQTGRRFVEIKKSGSKHVVDVAFKVPEALHSDTPSMLALESLLGGGNTSRLYRGLVEKGLATETWTENITFHDPSIIEICAVPTEGVSHEEVESAILEICKEVISKGVTKNELNQIKEQLLTSMAFARDGHYSMLSVLNEAIAVGDWRFYFDLPKKMEGVTVVDVKKVAKTYLDTNNMTVGYYRAI